MRINVVIDDNLIKYAMYSSGLNTQKAVIEAGLKLLVKFDCQARTRKYRGKLKWSGDLDKMRSN